MKKQPVSKLTFRVIALHVLSGFIGFLMAGMFLDIASKTGWPVGYIGAALIGAFVLVANGHQLYVLNKGG